MANPRSTVDFSEIQPIRLTFIADGTTITFDRTLAGGSAQVGLAVKVSASKTVALAANTDGIVGVLVLVEPDGMCTVQAGGVCTFKGGTSATLTVGTPVHGDLLVAAEGYIQTAAAGGTGRGMILDASDTAAVKVWLF